MPSVGLDGNGQGEVFRLNLVSRLSTGNTAKVLIWDLNHRNSADLCDPTMSKSDLTTV